MILTDTGPLVAIIDQDEAAHARCVEALGNLRGPMLTTWPVFTEAMYLLGEAGGWPAQSVLWRVLRSGHLQLVDISSRGLSQIPDLMERYSDLPMDLADASLVVVAKEKGLHRIFTLDSHFRAYRLRGGKGFTLIP